MQLRLDGFEWPKQVWKVVTNPAFEVIAAIVVVLFAACVVIQAETEHRIPHLPAVSSVK